MVALGGAAALRRHTQAGDDDGANHSPRPLVKTRRYETPEAPDATSCPLRSARRARQGPQVEVGERGAGQRLDNFLARILKDVPRSPIFRIDAQGRGARERQARQARSAVAGERQRARAAGAHRRGGAAAARAAAHWSRASTGAIVYEDDGCWCIDKPAGRRRAWRQRRELRRHRGAARRAAR